MKFRSISLISIFVISFAVVGYLVAKSGHRGASPGFTLYITQTAYPADAPPIVSATTVRYQKSDGNWKTETTYSNGRVDVGYGQVGKGVVHVDEANHRLEYISGMSGVPQSFTEDYWRRQPAFVGEEDILGYKTFHVHWEQNGDFSDSYMCPSLQGYPLRHVTGNSRLRTVFEVNRVVVGEPSFPAAPNYPLDKSRYEQIHDNK